MRVRIASAGGSEIENEVKFRRLLDREISSHPPASSLQYPADYQQVRRRAARSHLAHGDHYQPLLDGRTLSEEANGLNGTCQRLLANGPGVADGEMANWLAPIADFDANCADVGKENARTRFAAFTIRAGVLTTTGDGSVCAARSHCGTTFGSSVRGHA